jgi:hypothetical protein
MYLLICDKSYDFVYVPCCSPHLISCDTAWLVVCRSGIRVDATLYLSDVVGMISAVFGENGRGLGREGC